MNLKRSDKQYTDVEKFEEYEATSCLIYEMAIRHDRVVAIMKKEILGTSTLEDDNELAEYFLGSAFYTEYHFFKNENKINRFHQENPKFGITEVEILNQGEDCEMIRKHTMYDGFTHFQTISNNDDYDIPNNEKNTIFPCFKRPIIFNFEIDYLTEVVLDFTLPEDELVAYIKHIKRAFDKEVLKSPYDEFVNRLPKAKDKQKLLSRMTTMADMFYVYDCLKLGYSKRKVQNEVYNYYADKGIETKTLDFKTLNKYNDIAIEYINNKRYLELLTGKSLEEFENRNLKIKNSQE